MIKRYSLNEVARMLDIQNLQKSLDLENLKCRQLKQSIEVLKPYLDEELEYNLNRLAESFVGNIQRQLDWLMQNEGKTLVDYSTEHKKKENG